MFDIKKQFETDKQRELEGVWIPLSEDARIKVARANNPRYKERIAELSKPYRAAIRNNTLAPEVLTRITVKAMAETILLDWEGITENGEVVPYSVEKAEEFLQIEDFREFVSQAALDQALFRKQEDEQAEQD